PRGLPGAGFADQAMDLAPPDLHPHVVQREVGAAPTPVLDGEPPGTHDGRFRSAPSRRLRIAGGDVLTRIPPVRPCEALRQPRHRSQPLARVRPPRGGEDPPEPALL